MSGTSEHVRAQTIRDVTKFEFEFDDVRILDNSGVFYIRRIV